MHFILRRFRSLTVKYPNALSSKLASSRLPEFLISKFKIIAIYGEADAERPVSQTIRVMRLASKYV